MLPLRQVHLDFHTSPHIPDIAKDFDPDRFAQTFHDAHVQSVTVFAKCHHGMCYYPTKVGVRHPNLRRHDLLGEQIEALHRRGIRAPIYMTVAWEEDAAARFPQWRQMRADGTFARSGDTPHGRAPGGWKFNNFVHPEYVDYIEAHVRELLDAYPIDGLFFDILFFDRQAGHSDASLAFRAARGLLGSDDPTFLRFQTAAQLAFAERFTRLVRGRHPDATLFYNTPAFLEVDATLGMPAHAHWRTHWEIESLPSGFWGYAHFPRIARFARREQQPWLGMTGRFQRMWGDFGGFKPVAALEYECFRSQALGGGNSVGDQMHPSGRLDAATYDLIGRVYTACREAEPFYENTTALPQVGIVLSTAARDSQEQADLSLEGAIQMCDDAHYDSVVLNDGSDFSNLQLVILPDSTVLTPKLKEKLHQFLVGGGKLLASYRAGFDAGGAWALAPHLPLDFAAEDVQNFPTYHRVRPDFSAELARSDRVFYTAGTQVHRPLEVQVLIDRVLSYFRRTDLHFCSHAQTPPSGEIDADHPAALAGSNWIYFADPIFREYRRSGNLAVRDEWRQAMRRLIGPPPFSDGLPTTVALHPRRHGNDLRLTLLHYIPMRKALEIDIIEERMGFAGLYLQLPPSARELHRFDTGEALPHHEGKGFLLPCAHGRLLLHSPKFFTSLPT